MLTYEKLALYRKFNEGAELEDAVQLLIKSAKALCNVSADHELALVMLVIEKMIRDYMELGRNRELDWEDYDEIDPELYSYILCGAKKLTEAQYNY